MLLWIGRSSMTTTIIFCLCMMSMSCDVMLIHPVAADEVLATDVEKEDAVEELRICSEFEETTTDDTTDDGINNSSNSGNGTVHVELLMEKIAGYNCAGGMYDTKDSNDQQLSLTEEACLVRGGGSSYNAYTCGEVEQYLNEEAPQRVDMTEEIIEYIRTNWYQPKCCYSAVFRNSFCIGGVGTEEDEDDDTTNTTTDIEFLSDAIAGYGCVGGMYDTQDSNEPPLFLTEEECLVGGGGSSYNAYTCEGIKTWLASGQPEEMGLTEEMKDNLQTTWWQPKCCRGSGSGASAVVSVEDGTGEGNSTVVGDGDGDGDGDGTTYTALSTSPSTSVPLLSMSFFMPSGEEVSFCAHAAIGGAMMRQQQEQQQQISNSNHNKKQLSTTETITTNYFYSLIFQAAMTGEYFKVDVINNNDEDREDDNDVDKDHDKEDDSTSRTMKNNTQNDNYTCRLYMTSQYQEQGLSLEGQQILQELSEKLNWSLLSSSSKSPLSLSDNNDNDNFVVRTASVARPKTLVPLDSSEAVHLALPPPLLSTSATTLSSSSSFHPPNRRISPTTTLSATNKNFADSCDIMDDSTGVYVYASTMTMKPPHQEQQQQGANGISNCTLSFECRQFPRSSGYEEDPATGIAAAALAASLHFSNNNTGGGGGGGGGEYGDDSECGNKIENDTSDSNDNSRSRRSSNVIYDMYQGTAMGRPSLIQVVDLQREYDENDDDDDENNCDSDENKNTSNNKNNMIKDFRISFGLQGTVEIDDYCTIEVACDDDEDKIDNENNTHTICLNKR